MGSQKLALEPGAPKRLELLWRGRFKDFRATLDGNLVASAASVAELRNGISALLPDGTTLEVTLKNNGLQQQLVVLRDGQPVPGSGTHPLTHVRNAAYVLYLVAGLNALLGIVSVVNNAGEDAISGGIGMWIYAVIFAVLGFFALRPSFVAIAIGAALFALDGIYTLMAQLEAGQPNVFWVVFRILFLVYLFNGAKAARALKAQGPSSGPAAAA